MGKLLNCSSRAMMMTMVLIFWFFAAALMFMGIKMLMLVGSVEAAVHEKMLSLPAVVLILLSLLCLVIGIIGCAGASFANRKTQVVFFTLLLLIVVLECIGFFLCIAYKDQLKERINKTYANSVLKDYGTKNKNSTTNSIDYIQKQFECCGIDKAEDWENSTWAKSNPGHVPDSCCKVANCDTTIPAKGDKEPYYATGCVAKISGRISVWLGVLIALAVIFLLVEILALSCTCIRIKQSKKIKYQTLSEETAHGYRA